MAYDVNWDWLDDVSSDSDYTNYSDDWFSSGDYDFSGIADYDLSGSSDYDFFGGLDPNAANYENYSDEWFSPDMSGYGATDAGGYVDASADFGLGQAIDPESGSWIQPFYDAEKWTNQHKGLTSAGVSGLSFLASMRGAKKKEKQQKKAYDEYMREKAAAAARKAAYDAPWVPTPYRVRNQVAGPSVSDRYGISSRGTSSFASPSSYNYYDDNHVQLAKGGLACAPRRATGGQDDKVEALLSEGEYVFDADVVAALGDGNNAAGAAKLDAMRENIREHKRSAPRSEIPPKAKAPEGYLKGKK